MNGTTERRNLIMNYDGPLDDTVADDTDATAPEFRPLFDRCIT